MKLWISSSEAGAVALIQDHYGVGEDILNVESDGTGSAFLPEGTITILAVSADGKPLADLDCMAAPDSAPGLEPEDVGWATRADGRCTFTKKAMGYTVAVSTIDANGDRVILASGHVDVPPNGVASIRLEVEE